jgi:predicted ATPase
MIDQLRLLNFKCFGDQTLDLKALTLLSGLNGAGKSSVLQALLLLRQSQEQGLLDKEGLALNGTWVQLGTAADVLYEGAHADELGFALSANGYDSIWRFAYDRSADVVSLLSKEADERIYTTSLFTDDLRYIPAERTGPRTVFGTSDYHVRRHRQLGTRGEFTADYLSLFRDEKVIPEVKHLAEDSLSLLPQVQAWMQEVSPGVHIDLQRYDAIDAVSVLYSFAAGRLYSNPYRSTNVGFGITYTLPVIVALLSARPGTLVLLENPEAHLHPRGQVKMGELMSRASSGGVQVIVESHSDHVLNGVRIAVREKLLDPGQVGLLFFERREWDDQLVSRVTSPSIDSDGRITQWPEGFFDEWENSLLRLL